MGILIIVGIILSVGFLAQKLNRIDKRTEGLEKNLSDLKNLNDFDKGARSTKGTNIESEKTEQLHSIQYSLHAILKILEINESPNRLTTFGKVNLKINNPVGAKSVDGYDLSQSIDFVSSGDEKIIFKFRMFQITNESIGKKNSGPTLNGKALESVLIVDFILDEERLVRAATDRNTKEIISISECTNPNKAAAFLVVLCSNLVNGSVS